MVKKSDIDDFDGVYSDKPDDEKEVIPFTDPTEDEDGELSEEDWGNLEDDADWDDMDEELEDDDDSNLDDETDFNEDDDSLGGEDEDA